MSEALMRLPAVCAATGQSRSAIYRLIADGRFPRPIHPLGQRTAAWIESEVRAWVRARIAESRGGNTDAPAA